MIPTSTLVPIAAIIFTAIGLLLLLGIPKIKYGKIIGALSLLAGIIQFVNIFVFQMDRKTNYDIDGLSEDSLKHEMAQKEAIEEQKERSPATNELWVLTKSLIRSDKNQYKRLAKKANRLIKDGADVNFTNQRISSLYYAAQSDHAGIVKMLLDAGANANATNYDGRTPLLIASSHGDTKIVRLLMKAGADVNKPGKYAATPLWEAASGGHVEVVRLLIAAKADVRAHSANKVTPLHVAAWNGHTKVVKMLLAAGAEVNTAKYDEYEVFDNGATPLIDAAARCNTKTVELLIKAGASINAADKKGNTAMSLAKKAGCKKIIKILEAYGAKR